jgi:hypothetical protein
MQKRCTTLTSRALPRSVREVREGQGIFGKCCADSESRKLNDHEDAGPAQDAARGVSALKILDNCLSIGQSGS